MTDKKILVSGGLGYLGGRISRYLCGQGYSLVIGDLKLPARYPSWLGNSELRQLDILDEDSLKLFCTGGNTLIHLAAANEIVSAEDPLMALELNVRGTLKTLQAAAAAGLERFIYLSTAHVYGAPLKGRLDESVICRPAHPYSITHKNAEDYVLWYRDAGLLEGIVIRLSNAFGAPERADVDRWTLLVNDLCRQAVTERRLLLKSSGAQQRNFIAMSDVAAAVRHLVELDAAGTADGIFNVGGASSLSVFELASVIASRTEALFGYRPEIKRPVQAGPEPEQEQLEYSIERLKRSGFEPSGSMEKEIDETLLACAEFFMK